jgi:hypothetical protein
MSHDGGTAHPIGDSTAEAVPFANPLDRLIPTPRLAEVNHVDLAAPPDAVWQVIRHADLAESPWIRALFSLRALPRRLVGQPVDAPTFRIDDLVSSPQRPGFRVFVDEPPRQVVVGTIGKVWQGNIPFLDIPSVAEFAAFAAVDYAKVAWSIRVEPRGANDSRVTVEVRVDATDDAAWQKFRRYFRFIGIGSHFIRHSLLRAFAQRFGMPEDAERTRPLPGDELLPNIVAQDTHGISIDAPPEAIWPWLVQMGCGRGGYYSYDVLDNGGVRSARDIHPRLAQLAVGDVIPATPDSEEGFEVLQLDTPRCLILGGLYDSANQRQLPFHAPRPMTFWQVTWAFVLEPLDAATTRLHVRVRAACTPDGKAHARWIAPIHGFMESAQLRNLAARAEGLLPADDWRDVAEGVGGAGVMAAALLTPFLRGARNHWGVDAEVAARAFPGDERVPVPRWSWTHGIEVAAAADEVWPWVAQIGAGRGGFYSYAWLENLAGCEVQNAERVHPEWEVREGGELRLHPKMPPLRVVDLEPGRCFVAYGAPDPTAMAEGLSWAAVTWLFFVEPLGNRHCRIISRYRCATSDDLATRLSLGPSLIEPIGFAMDRRMLMGIKERAEREAKPILHFDVRAVEPR